MSTKAHVGGNERTTAMPATPSHAALRAAKALKAKYSTGTYEHDPSADNGWRFTEAPDGDLARIIDEQTHAGEAASALSDLLAADDAYTAVCSAVGSTHQERMIACAKKAKAKDEARPLLAKLQPEGQG